jgi:hypothetical protein
VLNLIGNAAEGESATAVAEAIKVRINKGKSETEFRLLRRRFQGCRKWLHGPLLYGRHRTFMNGDITGLNGFTNMLLA